MLALVLGTLCVPGTGLLANYPLRGQGTPASRSPRRSRHPPQRRVYVGTLGMSSSKCAEAEEAPPTSALATLAFGAMAEGYLLVDPADGACCRSACSGCEWITEETHTVDEGTGRNSRKVLFAKEEHFALPGERGWVPTYAARSIDLETSHDPRWAQSLFQGRSSVTKTDFIAAAAAEAAAHAAPQAAETAEEDPSPPPPPSERSCVMAAEVVWALLAPASASPQLSRRDVSAKLRALAASTAQEDYAARRRARMGLAPLPGDSSYNGVEGLTFHTFERAFVDAETAVAAAAQAEAAAGGDFACEGGDGYDDMEAADLLRLCVERGLANPPPMKRLLVEELRFMDQHGRPGVRNKRTRLLE
mmetsp:Transcript_68216/g.154329  ORF Transcript_68216/g.154329 Transcript_68216/m.154329 type:complete len:361 (+) Transcript_68216:37-1119(+)